MLSKRNILAALASYATDFKTYFPKQVVSRPQLTVIKYANVMSPKHQHHTRYQHTAFTTVSKITAAIQHRSDRSTKEAMHPTVRSLDAAPIVRSEANLSFSGCLPDLQPTKNQHISHPEAVSCHTVEPKQLVETVLADSATSDSEDQQAVEPLNSISLEQPAIPMTNIEEPAMPTTNTEEPVMPTTNTEEPVMPTTNTEKPAMPTTPLLNFEDLAQLAAYSKRSRLSGAHHTDRAKHVLSALKLAKDGDEQLEILENQIHLLSSKEPKSPSSETLDQRWSLTSKLKTKRSMDSVIEKSQYYAIITDCRYKLIAQKNQLSSNFKP